MVQLVLRGHARTHSSGGGLRAARRGEARRAGAGRGGACTYHGQLEATTLLLSISAVAAVCDIE